MTHNNVVSLLAAALRLVVAFEIMLRWYYGCQKKILVEAVWPFFSDL